MRVDEEKGPSAAAAEPRHQAKDRLRAKTPGLHPSRTKESLQRLDHEPGVYQVELETQNTELRRAQEVLEAQQIELELQNEELLLVQKELETSRNKYAELYDFAPVGYFTFDAHGMILEVNLTGAQLLGIARGMLAGKPFTRFIADAAGREMFAHHLETVLQKQGMHKCEIRLTGKDGMVIHGLFQSATVDTVENKGGYILCSIVDGTARKLAEAERARLDQELQNKNIELERATFVAEKANLAKSDFLSSMSHELRTPLSAILGFAQLMESGFPLPTPAQKRSIDQILKAGWYLLELINEILDLALIESGRLSMSLEPVSLTEVMRECETMIEPQAKKHGINVSFTPLETFCFVKADRTRAKQVLINLLSNAIKYNSAGGTVVVESVLNLPDSIRISVRDTGEGLAPEKIAQLFQPFNRLGQEANDEQGTGIGLVVCKRLVELMGGVIGVESTVGKGSMFWIELNLTAGPEIRDHAPEPAAAFPAQFQGAKQLHTVLYVEDNPANLMLVEDIIARRPDIRLLSAKDAKSGIKLARASLPDAILMDINLPGMSGTDAMRILTVDHKTAHIPVIALSANAIPHNIEKGLEAGFFHYLTKPIKVSEFMETLDVALKFAKNEAANKEQI